MSTKRSNTSVLAIGAGCALALCGAVYGASMVAKARSKRTAARRTTAVADVAPQCAAGDVAAARVVDQPPTAAVAPPPPLLLERASGVTGSVGVAGTTGAALASPTLPGESKTHAAVGMRVANVKVTSGTGFLRGSLSIVLYPGDKVAVSYPLALGSQVACVKVISGTGFLRDIAAIDFQQGDAIDLHVDGPADSQHIANSEYVLPAVLAGATALTIAMFCL